MCVWIGEAVARSRTDGHADEQFRPYATRVPKYHCYFELKVSYYLC